MDKILYSSGAAMAVKDYSGAGDTFESEYVNKYRENVLAVKKRHDWKNSGTSAMFQRGYTGEEGQEYDETSYSINDVCSYGEDSYIYSVTTGNVSGIISKSYKDGAENHIIHSNNYVFHNLDYNPATKKILTSVSSVSNALERNVAVLDINTSDLKLLTGGDSADDTPYFSGSDSKIYYSSKGIGRDNKLEFVEYSESALFSISENGDIKEVLSESGYDLLCPKTDKNNNLYYIRKPRSNRKGGKGFLGALLDVILIPFWLLYGVVNLAVYFANLSKKSAKREKKRTGGANPAVSGQKSERDLFIFGENIDAEKEEKKNGKKDKNAGFAPKTFELYKLTPLGEKVKIKSGILDYDVSEEGNVIYTNGKYVFLTDGGEEKPLFKDKIITKLNFSKAFEKSGASGFDPFS